MINNKQTKLAATLVLGASLLTGCTLFGGKNANEVVVAGSKPQTIVQHVGHDKPVISKLDRDSWVEIRKSSDNAVKKMYAALGAREWNVAITDARAYLAKKPKDFDALTVLAVGLAMDKQLSLASYYANLIEKFYGDNAHVKNIRGIAVYYAPNVTIQDYRQAMELFRQAFDMDSNQIAAGLNLGHVYLKMNNFQQAAETFQATEQRCNCEPALIGYGLATARLGQYKESKLAFEKVLDINPDSSLALYRLALIEKDVNKDWSKAKRHLEKLLAAPSETNLDIKRRANFLLQSIEARKLADDNNEEDIKPTKTTLESNE
ncbi:MAG: tetratricopeptide repeat protein [Oligoflexales bacterium]